MSINLSAIFQAPTGVTSNQISYARIDGITGAPVFTQAGNFVTSPAVIASNIPAGQYQVNIIPIYPDGRVCQPTTYTTPSCPGLNSITAYISSGNLMVTYNAPSTAPKVRITVGYPNGGSNVANYVNNGNPIVIPLPSGLTGDFTVNGQSVCDETSGFYSGLSSTVVVTVGAPVAGTYSLGSTSTAVCGATPGTFYTDGPFAVGSILYTDSGLSNVVTGFNFVGYNSAIYAIDPSTGIIGAATGSVCNATITGLTTMNPVNPTSSGNINAPAGATVHVQLNANGPSGGTYGLTVNIGAPLSLVYSTSNGINTFIFTMPPSGSVTWAGTFSSSNGSGSSTITVS